MSNRGKLIRERNRLAAAIGSREPKRPIFRALTGDGTGGDTRIHVRVEDEPTRMYVRVEGRGVLEAVVGVDIPMRHDVPVYVGPTQENPDVYEILGINFGEITDPGGYSYVASHHWSHEFLNDQGGDDVVWVNKSQFLPFLGAPTDPASTDIYVYPGFYLYLADWQYFPGSLSGDLTAYNPAAGLAKYVLVSINAETNVLAITDGVEFPPFPPTNPSTNIPQCPARHFPVTAVYLLNATATITWNNLYDVRLMVGGGVNTTVPGPHHFIDTVTHDETAAHSVPTTGAMIYSTNFPSWDDLLIGTEHQLLKVTDIGGGILYPRWHSFDWDTIRQAAGADMVHNHSSNNEGGNSIYNADVNNTLDFSLDPNTVVINAGTNIPYHSYAIAQGVGLPFDDVLGIQGGAQSGSICFLHYDGGVNPVDVSHRALLAAEQIVLAGGASYDLTEHPILLIRNDNDGKWYEIDWTGSVGGVGAHDILSATHGDSHINSVERGALITGQFNIPGVTEWTRLRFPGDRHHLQTDDQDVIWDLDISMEPEHWIGLGDASGYGTGQARIKFIDGGLGRDVIANLDADVGVGTEYPNIAGEPVGLTIESATSAPTLELSLYDDIFPANTMIGVMRWYAGVRPDQLAVGQIDVVVDGYYDTDSTMEFWVVDDGALELALELYGMASTGARLHGEIDWAAGNVIHVPLGASIQAYVDKAVAGDTLILASGQYTITSTITIDKQLNIYGQGNAGFLTAPITTGHGTLISSTTDNITAFQISNDNVRIAHLSINLTGAASKGINTANNLIGFVLTNVDIIVMCSGWAQGATIIGTDAVLRDVTFYVTSTNLGATGVWIYNDGLTTQNSVVDCWNVTGTAQGTSLFAWAFYCQNNDAAHTVTLNLSNSVCRVPAGTVWDAAVVSTGTFNNAVINGYMCTFDGADWDAYQTGTNQLNIGGSVLANNSTFGTITYRAAMTSALGIFSTSLGVGVTAAATRLDIGAGAMTLSEMAAPGAGAANTCRLYCVDNGGKTELYAIFATGAAQLIAAEP